MHQPLDRHHRRQRRVLRAIAGLEFCKGVFVILMGICALLLLHKDLWLYAESLLAKFHISTDRKSAQMFLDFADDITDAKLWAAARIAFAYSALRFTEAYGLWWEKAWAEWIALISGAIYLPFEIRLMAHRVSLLHVSVFLINLAIVIFMFYLRIYLPRQEKQKLVVE